MKKSLYIILAIAFAGWVTGCQSKKAAAASFSDLGGEWNIVEMNGQKLPPEETRPFLSFDVAAKRVSGYTGCNRLSGAIIYDETQKNNIQFSKVITTRMACMDMRYENEVLKTLDKIARFGASKEVTSTPSILLYGADDTPLLVLEKR